MTAGRRVFRTVRRWGVGAFLILLVLLVLAAAAISLALWTETGTRLAVPLVKGLVPRTVTWDSLGGRLAGPLFISGLEVTTPGADVRVVRAMVDWQPLPLLRRRLHVDSVRVTGLHLDVRAPGDETTDSTTADSMQAPAALELPLAVAIDTLVLNGGTVSIPGVAEISDLSLSLSGTPEDYGMRADASVHVREERTVELRLHGRGSLRSAAIDSLYARTEEGEAYAEGNVSWFPDPAARLRIRAHDLDPSDFHARLADWPGRVNVSVSVDGKLEGAGPVLEIRLDTLAGVLRGLPVSGQAVASYHPGLVRIDPVELTWGALTAYVKGVYEDSLAFTFALRIPDLAQVLPEASGALEVEGEVFGNTSDPGLTSRFEVRNAAWRNYAVMRAKGDVRIAPGGVSRSILNLGLDSARASDVVIDSVRFELHGTRQQHTYDLTLAALESELSVSGSGRWLDTIWSGRLIEMGMVSANARRWNLDAPVDLSVARHDVSVSPVCLSAGSGRLCAGGRLRADGSWHLEFSSSDVPMSWTNRFLPEGAALSGPLESTVRLDRAAGGTRLDAVLEPGPGYFALPGVEHADTLYFDRSHLAVSAGPESTSVALQSTFSRRSGVTGTRVQADLRWPALIDRALAGDLDLMMLLESEPWAARLEVSGATMENLGVALPEALAVDGSVNVKSAVALDPASGLSGSVDVMVPAGHVRLVRPDDTTTMRWEASSLALRIDTGGVNGRLNTSMKLADESSVGSLAAELRAPGVRRIRDFDRNASYTVTLAADFDMRVLDLVVPELAKTSGRVVIDSRVEGTGPDLQLLGTAEIEGRTTVPALGITLDSLSLKAQGTSDGVAVAGGARSGSGSVTLSGHVTRVPSGEAPTTFKVKGSNFLTLSRPQAEVHTSPDLNVSFDGARLDITGTILVPRATLDILEIPESAVAISKDVVVVGQEPSSDSGIVDVSARVQIRLGDQVFFKGFGLSTFLGGQITAIEKPGSATQGQGELSLREGRYRGYGQDLTVDPGRLIFDGPIDNPRLDVTAYRKADDNTRAGFKVTGYLQEPDVRLYSDPAKSDEDIMSYILFGRSMSQGTESDQMRASDAAALVGGNILAAQAASSVGLDDARIEPGSKKNDAAFYAGKYLSPKLYVAYGTGIYESINTLRVRYILSKHFTLQAETGTRETIDIIYQIER